MSSILIGTYNLVGKTQHLNAMTHEWQSNQWYAFIQKYIHHIASTCQMWNVSREKRWNPTAEVFELEPGGREDCDLEGEHSQPRDSLCKGMGTPRSKLWPGETTLKSVLYLCSIHTTHKQKCFKSAVKWKEIWEYQWISIRRWEKSDQAKLPLPFEKLQLLECEFPFMSQEKMVLVLYPGVLSSLVTGSPPPSR